MRALNALLRVLRTRRNRHPEPDPIASTDRPGLADLLEAARAPGTPEELAGEKEVVAAFVAHRKRAARAQRRRTPARIRAVLVPATTGLALLILTGTAVAARTGNLPQEAQQHAHRLFSALGVPEPRTGTPGTPSPSRPAPRPTPDITALTWCEAWRGAPGRTLSREDRRKLSAAAGGEPRIEKYCVDLHREASHKPVKPATPPPPTGPAPNSPPTGPAASSPPPTTPSATTTPGREGPPTPGRRGSPGTAGPEKHPTPASRTAHTPPSKAPHGPPAAAQPPKGPAEPAGSGQSARRRGAG